MTEHPTITLCGDSTWEPALHDAMCTECARIRTIKSQNKRIAELEERIQELTEWRPIATMPTDGDVLVTDGEYVGKASYHLGEGFYSINIVQDRLLGWLPLPEIKK